MSLFGHHLTLLNLEGRLLIFIFIDTRKYVEADCLADWEICAVSLREDFVIFVYDITYVTLIKENCRVDKAITGWMSEACPNWATRVNLYPSDVLFCCDEQCLDQWASIFCLSTACFCWLLDSRGLRVMSAVIDLFSKFNSCFNLSYFAAWWWLILLVVIVTRIKSHSIHVIDLNIPFVKLTFLNKQIIDPYLWKLE